MERSGFDPTVHNAVAALTWYSARAHSLTTALADPDTVCSLHLGIAEGVAELTDGRIAATSSCAMTPARRTVGFGCTARPEARPV